MHYLSSIYFISQPLTCFRHNCSQSSGGVLYIYNNWYVLCWKEGCLKLLKHIYISLKRVKHIVVIYICLKLISMSSISCIYIYSTPPDDGLQICPKYVEDDWRNKLKINSASSWFSLHGCIEMQRKQNIKFISIIVTYVHIPTYKNVDPD